MQTKEALKNMRSAHQLADSEVDVPGKHPGFLESLSLSKWKRWLSLTTAPRPGGSVFSEEIVLGSFIPTWPALGFPLCPALSVPSFSVVLVFSFRESGENLGPLQSMKGAQS